MYVKSIGGCLSLNYSFEIRRSKTLAETKDIFCIFATIK